MVEVIVVLLVIAILAAIGWAGVRSARTTGTLSVAIATAHSYANAADGFARDHEGRYPDAPGSIDWPEPDAGPKSQLLGAKGYLRTVPEAVQDDTVVVGPRGDAAAGIVYRPVGTGYEIILDVRNRDECAIRGGGATGSIVECSRR